MYFSQIRYKSIKNLKNFKSFGRKNAKFVHFGLFLYLCTRNGEQNRVYDAGKVLVRQFVRQARNRVRSS